MLKTDATPPMSDPESATPDGATAIGARADADRRREDRAKWLGLARTLGLDVLGPIALHSWLTKQGWSEVNALMVSAALPAVGLVTDKLRGKRLGGLSILVLGGIVLSIVLGLITGDARSVLLEGGLSSAAAGIFATVTLFTRRTLVELFAGAAGDEDTEAGRTMAEAFRRDDVRRLARAVTVVFAAVFFVSAAIQFALAAWAPIDVAFAYNRFGFIPCLAVIAVASWALFRRARARGEVADLMPGGTPDQAKG